MKIVARMSGAIRKEHEGFEWLDVGTLRFDVAETLKQVKKDEERLGMSWAASNPVVRVSNFRIAEHEVLLQLTSAGALESKR